MSLSQIVSGESFGWSDAFPGDLVNGEIEPDELTRSVIGQGMAENLGPVATVMDTGVEIEDVKIRTLFHRMQYSEKGAETQGRRLSLTQVHSYLNSYDSLT